MMAPVKDKWVRRFIMPETARHKKGFTIYKVTSVVFLKSSREEISKVSVWKRYNDFKKLHSELSVLHARSQIKEAFPSFPKSKFFGRFEAEVIQERRERALKFLDFIGRHSLLYTSDIFIKFFDTSHTDNCVNDCSQSISSDTSEDDRYAVTTNITSQNLLQHVSSASQNSTKSSNNILPNFIQSDTVESAQSEDILKGDSVKANLHTLEETEKSCTEDKNSQNCYNEKLNDGVCYNNNNNNNNNNNFENNITNVTNEEQHLSHNAAYDQVSSVIIHDGSDLPQTQADTTQYILIAAAHMSAAFKHEAIAEYEEAFTQYKMGISNLLTGVQSDPDIPRAATVKEKISKYLERAEKLYNRHLNCNVSMLSKPISELQHYKVLKVVNYIMLVQDIRFNSPKIVKTIEKIPGKKNNICNYILRGQIPHMVHLHACVETETTVFLILQYISRGKLWDFITSHYKVGDIHSPERECFCPSTNDNRTEGSVDEIYDHDSKIDQESGLDKNTQYVEINKQQINDVEQPIKVQSKIYDSDVPTTQLLEEAQKLLQSVNATLKKSNSIASRLNESKQLLYQDNSTIVRNARNITNTPEEPKIVLTNVDKKCTESNSINTEGPAKSTSQKTSISLTISSSIDDSVGDQYSLHKFPLSSSCTDLRSCQNKLPDNSKTFYSCWAQCNKNDIVASNIRKELSKSCDTEKSDCLNSINSNCHVKDVRLNEDVNICTEQVLWKVPETVIRLWAAEILLALEALHQQDVIVLDLKPDNILLDNAGHIKLTYITPYRNIELSKLKEPYSSPELCMFFPTIPITPSTDIWSFGVILYELFTGTTFQSRHPGPFHSHSTVNISDTLSESSKSLLLNVLKYQPNERLTIPEIKQHSFFEEIDWYNLMNF